MGNLTLQKTFIIDGVLANVTSVKLSDPTSAYGVKRNDTDAVVVVDDTSMTNPSVGVYQYTFVEPTLDLEYTCWFEWVYGNETFREEHVRSGALSNVSITSHFTTTNIFEDKIRKLAADHSLDMYANEEQTISISGVPTGGTFTLTYNEEETAAIVYNASAANIATALSNLMYISSDDIECRGGALPANPVIVKFKGDLGKKQINTLEIDISGLIGGSNLAGSVNETIKGYGDSVVAARRLDQAYNIIEGALLTRGLTTVQISTWCRGEEFQLDIATYWYAKDCGWGGKLVEEVDWTTVFNREGELATVPIVNNTGVLLLAGKEPVGLAMDFMQINEDKGISY